MSSPRHWPPPSRWPLLLMLSANMLLDALEVSTIVIAMPSIGTGLGLTPAAASWTMTGFALGFGSTILLGARLAARLGRRRMYLGALLIFAVASIVGALAPAGALLVATRIVKGVSVALTAPTGLAIIAGTFPEGPARNRAVSVYSLFGASGFSAGLLLSGALTSVSWRATLLFSGPVALVLLLFGRRIIPADDTAAARPRFDVRALAGTVLLRSAAGAAALNGPYWGFLLLTTFQFQWGNGASPLAVGLALLPSSLPLMLSAPFSGRMVSRFGSAQLIAAGSLAAFLGYLWYFAAGTLLPTALLVGVGFMLSFSALHFQAIAGVAPNRRDLVSGLYQTSVQLGGAIMLVLVAAVTGLRHQPALLLITSVAAAGLLLALAGLRAARPTAPRGKSWTPTRSRSLSS